MGGARNTGPTQAACAAVTPPGDRFTTDERAGLPVAVRATTHAVAVVPIRATNRTLERSPIMADGSGFAVAVGRAANDGAGAVGAVHGARHCSSTGAFRASGGAHVTVRHLRPIGGLGHLRFRGHDGGERRDRTQRQHSGEDDAFHEVRLSLTLRQTGALIMRTEGGALRSGPSCDIRWYIARLLAEAAASGTAAIPLARGRRRVAQRRLRTSSLDV